MPTSVQQDFIKYAALPRHTTCTQHRSSAVQQRHRAEVLVSTMGVGEGDLHPPPLVEEAPHDEPGRLALSTGGDPDERALDEEIALE